MFSLSTFSCSTFGRSTFKAFYVQSHSTFSLSTFSLSTFSLSTFSLRRSVVRRCNAPSKIAPAHILEIKSLVEVSPIQDEEKRTQIVEHERCQTSIAHISATRCGTRWNSVLLTSAKLCACHLLGPLSSLG